MPGTVAGNKNELNSVPLFKIRIYLYRRMGEMCIFDNRLPALCKTRMLPHNVTLCQPMCSILFPKTDATVSSIPPTLL